MAGSEVQPPIGVGEEGEPGDQLREDPQTNVRAQRMRVRARRSRVLRQN